jgi:Tfp pilus assembly protein PilF/two-component sensor histidine kinase
MHSDKMSQNRMTHRLFLILVLLTPWPVTTAFAETSSAEARQHFEQGMRFLSLKETDKALAELRRAIELDEEDYVAPHREFQDHTREQDKRRKPALIAEYRRRVQDHPDNPIFHYLLGRLLDGTEAVKEYERSVELDPNFFWGHLGLAGAYRNIPEKSEAELRLALALCPEDGYAHAHLALNLFRARMFDEAIAEFEKAKALGTDDHTSHVVGTLIGEVPGIRKLNVIAFFAYLVAVLLCTAFLVGALKGELRKSTLSRAELLPLVLLLFSSLWFYLLFIQSAREVTSFSSSWRGMGVVRFLIMLCDAFWPAIIYHVYFRSSSQKIHLHPVYRHFLAYFYAAALIVTGIFSYALVAFRSHRFELFESLLGWGMRWFVGNFLFCAFLVVVTFVRVNRAIRASQEEPEVRSSRRWHIFMWAAWLLVLWPVVIATVLGVISPTGYLRYFGLLATLMPLALVLVNLYYEARYVFVDLLIKKSAVLLVMGMMAVFYYVYVVEPFARSSGWRSIGYPALLILVPLVVASAFARGVETLLERYVFKRKSSPAEFLSGFSRAIRYASDEQQLLEISKKYLSEMFSTRNVFVVFAEESDDARFPMPQVRRELQKTTNGCVLRSDIQDPETADCCRQNSIEVIVPLRIGEKISGYIALGRRHYKEPYMSEDLGLLHSLADQLEFALENLALEKKRRDQELKEKELKILASRAELRALRAQINPHFLFNALNTIASLIRKTPNKAEETVEMLADVFRYTLAKSGTDIIPLAEELNFLQAYLEIEKARFGSKLQVEIKVDPQAEQVKIPSMLLQPLVENAIKHGIAPKVEGGKVAISAACENNLLKVEVADNGVGFDCSNAQRLYRDGVGMKNVRDRLKTLYGNEDGLQIQSTPNVGTKILIAMPVRAVEL